MVTRSSPSGRRGQKSSRRSPIGVPAGTKPGEHESRSREGDREQSARGNELIYGRNPVREALRGRRRLFRVWVAEGKGVRALEQSLNDWCTAVPRAVPSTSRLSDRELGLLVKTEDHQGIAAEVEPYPYLDLEPILDNQDLIVALDQIQDPQNLGAIIRTAEAAGAGVLIPRHRAAEVTAAVVKASAGATEHASVARVRNLADALGQAKEAGFWIYGAAAEADALYTSEDYQPPTCFVVGSEGQGLSQRVAAACDVMVCLPLNGRTDSLNVSVSAGVLLYEAVRQRAAHSARERDPRMERRP